ncbi:hypothetical protein V5799_017433 [Amblyomma americanum]|uniref:Uncharacterized protein n=1 Tax=Amblyomma americanum TaxID=6943 RepID=A0AAQ4F291_AMBAM
MSDDPERQELILRRYLRNLRIEGGYCHRYLKSENDLLQFEMSLAARHEKYSVLTSREFDAAPEATATDWSQKTFEKKRLNVQGTKKKGCHATLSLKWIELFPDFKCAAQAAL